MACRDQYSLKAPFLTQIHFLHKKIPPENQFFSKSSIFYPNAPNNPFKTSIFSKSPIFDPNTLSLPTNPFRTLIFPKSPISDPNALNFIQNPFKTSILLKSPIFNPEASFYQNVPSGHHGFEVPVNCELLKLRVASC